MKRALIVALAITSACFPAVACMWDYDTLAMERQRFPDTLELITGKFLRHSRPFYEWRRQDREQRLQNEQSPELYDDLAVAYEKLGDPQKAIEVMLKKQQYFPNLYETHANLGTFYIHAGQLEAGVREIETAIEMNPDAHFGREVYQKLLVNYVRSRQTENSTRLPLGGSKDLFERHSGFVQYLSDEQGLENDYDAIHAESRKAIKGVLGMMRFGNYNSPILLEALGDLLLSGVQESEDAKRLAARAFLKASYEAKDKESQEAYREFAKDSLAMQTKHSFTKSDLSLESLEATFRKELAEADEWFAAIAADEARWLSEGVNLDEAFARKYYRDPSVTAPMEIWLKLLITFFAIIVAIWCIRLLRKRSQTSPEVVTT